MMIMIMKVMMLPLTKTCAVLGLDVPNYNNNNDMHRDINHNYDNI